jgi:hypothetical protein
MLGVPFFVNKDKAGSWLLALWQHAHSPAEGACYSAQ